MLPLANPMCPRPLLSPRPVLVLLAAAQLALTIEDGPNCAGTFAWTQAHDPDAARGAVVHWKTCSTPPGAGVMDRLERD